MSSSDTSPTSGGSSAELLAAAYEELRGLARGHMAAEAAPQTLTATGLVHEAWLRVSQHGDPQWENRRHFYGAAAQAMRRILIERARARQRMKRGGGAEHVEFEESQIIAPAPDDELLAVNEALTKLAAADPAAAEIVHLRYFAGLKWSEMAELTGLSERELGRQWEYARAWLRTEISSERT